MARHSGVTFKSKKHNSSEMQNSDLLPDQFSERRRPAKAAPERRFVLQVDRQMKESFQTREAAARLSLRRSSGLTPRCVPWRRLPTRSRAPAPPRHAPDCSPGVFDKREGCRHQDEAKINYRYNHMVHR
jgi:hypothetical protein